MLFGCNRVGWSLDVAELGLGEVPNSYGFGGTGKTSSANKFNTYGEPYGPGDVIGCFLVSAQQDVELHVSMLVMCVCTTSLGCPRFEAKPTIHHS